MPSPTGRSTVLVIHDDGDVLDLLTRLFEAGGFDVITAVSGMRAESHLEGVRSIDVVVAPWDATHPVGGEIYRWSLSRRYDLRGQFVFIANEVTPEFDRVVGGRCLAVSVSRPADIVRVAEAVIRQRVQLEANRQSMPELTTLPTLLLAEDEPVLLMVMGELLTSSGYAVKQVESGNAAIAALEQGDYDVIVSDWRMDAGSGGELYKWLVANKPLLVDRIVFLSGGDVTELQEAPPGRPMFRKGQDSQALTAVLTEIVRHVRGADGGELDQTWE